MVKISKKEAFVLRDLGYSEFVKKSHSKHPTYYCVEDKNDVYKYDKVLKKKILVKLGALNMLKKYRESIGITD